MEKGVRLVVCEAEPQEVAVPEEEEQVASNDGTSTGGAASIVVAIDERLGDDSDLDDELESIFHHHRKGDPHSSSANQERSEIHTLPDEIIVQVLQRVTEATAVCRAAQTCRTLRVLCAPGALWRRLFQVRWGDAEECRPCEHPLCFRSNADHDSRTHWKEAYIKWHAVDQNWKTGSCSVNSLEGHVGSVCACAITGENTLVTVGEDSSIKWWDLAVMRCNFSLDKAHLVYHPYPYLYLHSSLRSNY